MSLETLRNEVENSAAIYLFTASTIINPDIIIFYKKQLLVTWLASYAGKS